MNLRKLAGSTNAGLRFALHGVGYDERTRPTARTPAERGREPRLVPPAAAGKPGRRPLAGPASAWCSALRARRFLAAAVSAGLWGVGVRPAACTAGRPCRMARAGRPGPLGQAPWAPRADGRWRCGGL